MLVYMNWEERTVSNTLTVERYTVNDIIVNYLEDQFYVNRRYQRKLVWGVEEKRLLIDSMIKGIPLPAVLLVKYDVPEGKKNILEIVDGMQRLNAIISFVLGEFGIEYNGNRCYFDFMANNETFQLSMSNDERLKKHEKGNILPKDLCLEFCRYQLPAIITGQDNTTVDMIFSRINSTGRKISSQDLRQSMAVGEFPDLVRRIASNVRLDHTYDDHICFCDIPKISIGYKQYGYGIDLNFVFWRRHDLIDSQHIKESKDEEIIETLLAIVLLEDFKKSKEKLDQLYQKGTELNNQVENKVLKFGKDILEDKFRKVFDTIDMIFNAVNSDFSSFLFNNERINNKDECFKILFLAIYRLLSEGFVISGYKTVANSIKSADSILDPFTKRGKIDYEKANEAVNNLYTLLKPTFSKKIPKKLDKLEEDIDKRLSYSKIEMQMTEFKIGISDFASDSINYKCIHKIAKTLVTMANTNNTRDKTGYVLIGIADSKELYDNWYARFKEQSVVINQHYVPGITCEAGKLFGKTGTGSSDSYVKVLRKAIKDEPISQKLKDYILENFDLFNYHEVKLVILRSKNVGESSLYDGKKFVWHGNETVKV